MFKSKGFTAGFIALSILILALLGVLIYLLVGRAGLKINLNKQKDTIVSASSDDDVAEMPSDDLAPESEEPSSDENELVIVPADTSVRALTNMEDHVFPLINEVIPTSGMLTIIQAGDQGEGICFHANPAFDDAATEGNEMRTSGTYEVSGKVFILDNGKPYLMYQVADGLFVTSNRTYIQYDAVNTPKTPINPAKVTGYGYNENSGLALTVYQEDGDHAAFSIFSLDAASMQTEDLIVNVVGEYNTDGALEFEYHNSDDQIYDGTISFIGAEDGSISADIHFGNPISVNGSEISEVTLHN